MLFGSETVVVKAMNMIKSKIKRGQGLEYQRHWDMLLNFRKTKMLLTGPDIKRET